MAKNKPQPERIDVRGMDYAPVNEQGVVFLFALLAPQLGFKGLEKIQVRFPDAIARRRGARGDERVNIEFEYRSSSYPRHRHSLRERVTIVCWIHDWADKPENIDIIELRREAGQGFHVWTQSVWEKYWDQLDQNPKVSWSAPSLAKPGDLVLMYRVQPAMHIEDILVQTSPIRPHRDWKYYADFKRVCKLKRPIMLDDLKITRGLSNASFVRGQFQGRRNITADWPLLYNLIVRLNRVAVKPLAKFAPQWL